MYQFRTQRPTSTPEVLVEPREAPVHDTNILDAKSRQLVHWTKKNQKALEITHLPSIPLGVKGIADPSIRGLVCSSDPVPESRSVQSPWARNSSELSTTG